MEAPTAVGVREKATESPMPNRKYLVFLRSVPGNHQPVPEQMEGMRVAFGKWMEKYKDNIMDLGGRLKPDGKLLSPSGVTDGPFTEAKEVVGGFMIVGAEDYDGAVAIARECPGVVRPGATVEIREIASS
jgi:hypothetical protein